MLQICSVSSKVTFRLSLAFFPPLPTGEPKEGKTRNAVGFPRKHFVTAGCFIQFAFAVSVKKVSVRRPFWEPWHVIKPLAGFAIVGQIGKKYRKPLVDIPQYDDWRNAAIGPKYGIAAARKPRERPFGMIWGDDVILDGSDWFAFQGIQRLNCQM